MESKLDVGIVFDELGEVKQAKANHSLLASLVKNAPHVIGRNLRSGVNNIVSICPHGLTCRIQCALILVDSNIRVIQFVDETERGYHSNIQTSFCKIGVTRHLPVTKIVFQALVCLDNRRYSNGRIQVCFLYVPQYSFFMIHTIKGITQIGLRMTGIVKKKKEKRKRKTIANSLKQIRKKNRKRISI